MIPSFPVQEFMVHSADHRENVDEDVDVCSVTDELKGGFQQVGGYEDPRGKGPVGHSIIGEERFLPVG
ncbi:hypothetical protein Y032_0092g2562 [Ancylostoma ceylanicum]|uniref:Uncharacterized protein n=1 Tax=Ancylostoma ceylanicum TaxID=53326 RepID=A0A016TLS8_9BILA|nr:hypothetical protein Y032_0092g2562 [Ancylostoma ceylanicum]